MPCLKKFILIVLVGFGAWKFYSEKVDNSSSMPVSGESYRQAPAQSAQSRFSCDGRQHCSQMTSRAEAEFFTRNCPNTKMDGDRDGIPCENDSRF